VNWRRKLIGANLELYLALLEDHNNMVHGASKIENAQKVYQLHHQMWMTKQLQGKTKGQLTLREALGHYDKCPP